MKILGDFVTSVRRALDEIDSNWESYDGLIVAGSHSRMDDHEEILREVRDCRVAGKPFLGICAGHQIAAVEYARNVLGILDATSEEWRITGQFIVQKLPQLNVGLRDGETFWNNYEVVPGFEKIWRKGDNFITVQYHPEFQSSKDKPHPILVKFLEYAKR